jgi:hypothetical protein
MHDGLAVGGSADARVLCYGSGADLRSTGADLPKVYSAGQRSTLWRVIASPDVLASQCVAGRASVQSARGYASVDPEALATRAFEHVSDVSGVRVHHRSYKLHFLAADSAGSA